MIALLTRAAEKMEGLARKTIRATPRVGRHRLRQIHIRRAFHVIQIRLALENGNAGARRQGGPQLSGQHVVAGIRSPFRPEFRGGCEDEQNVNARMTHGFHRAEHAHVTAPHGIGKARESFVEPVFQPPMLRRE